MCKNPFVWNAAACDGCGRHRDNKSDIRGPIPKGNNLNVLSNSVMTLAQKMDPLSTDIKNLSTSISTPSRSTPTGILVLDAIIGLGAVIAVAAAAIIAFKANKWVQNRQESVEMAKLKICTITSMLPLYGKLVSNYWSFSSELTKIIERKQPNARFCFYRLCLILLYRNSLYTKYGGLKRS
jgi:hypothetical protein